VYWEENNEGFLTYIPLSPQNQKAGVTSDNVARKRNLIGYYGHKGIFVR